MKKKSTVFRILGSMFLLLFSICIFPIKASADIGAKPSIYIKLVNAPENCYVALLDDWNNEDAPYNTELRDFDPENETIDEYLENFSYERWTYFTSFWENNYYKPNEKNAVTFDYDVPDPFRILVIDEAGPVKVSEVFDKREFNASITYDYAANTITEHYVGKLLSRIIQVLGYYLLTLVFEWIVFLLFKFPRNKRNIISFLVVNAITNIPYNIFRVYFLSRAGWPGLFVAGFLEIIIMIFEAIVYSFALVTDKGEPGPKCFGYGIVANVFSVFMGMIMTITFFMIVDFLHETLLH